MTQPRTPAEEMRYLQNLLEGHQKLNEFIPFTNGASGAPGVQTQSAATTAPAGTTPEAPKDPEDKQPWEMTRNEVRALPQDQINRLFWKPAAEHIWSEAGSREPEKILAFYSKKYNLPDIAFEYSNKLAPNVNGEAQKDTGGKWKIVVTPRLQSQPYERTIVVRHEVEHVIDDENYGFEATVDRAIDTPDGQGGLNVKAGHHKYYGQFNSDYSHRVVVRDALHTGKKIPTEVLKDYPDIH